jgi:hypothetical protein
MRWEQGRAAIERMLADGELQQVPASREPSRTRSTRAHVPLTCWFSGRTVPDQRFCLTSVAIARRLFSVSDGTTAELSPADSLSRALLP